jgi:hypothetical protein
MLQTFTFNTSVLVGPGGSSSLTGLGERKQPLPKPPSGKHTPIEPAIVTGSLANHSTGGRPAS